MNTRVSLALILLLPAGCTRTVPADVASFVARVHRTPFAQDRHDPRALELYEESEALRERYAAVGRWPSLERVRQELAGYLNEHPPDLTKWEDKIGALRRCCAEAVLTGRFTEALRWLDEFGARFGEEKNSRLARELEGERQLLDRRALVWARTRCADAFYERSSGRKADARRLLLEAHDGLSRFDSARELVSKALAEMRD